MRLDLSGSENFESLGIFSQNIFLGPDKSKRIVLWQRGCTRAGVRVVLQRLLSSAPVDGLCVCGSGGASGVIGCR